MNIHINKAVLYIPFLALALSGCNLDNGDAQLFENKAYLSVTDYTDDILVSDESDTYTREVTMSIARPEEHGITAVVRTAPELYETYREAYYDEDIDLLPDGICNIENPDVQIAPGSVTSSPATVVFSNTGSLDRNKRYVMPVCIDNIQGIGMLASSRNMYYVFRGASLINVVVNLSENRAWPEWDNFTQVRDMEAFTFEALIHPNSLDKTISTIMGIEDTFLIRCGDSGINPNQLQIVGPYSVKLTNTDMRIPVGEWTHIAVTFNKSKVYVYINGEEKADGYMTVNSINFDIPHSDESASSGQTITRCFWVGYSFEDARYFDGEMSEIRIWNRALTQSEIAASEHFYKVDPESEGLVAYWKLDDGAGNTAKDYSVYGNDLTIEETPEWIDVTLPERN